MIGKMIKSIRIQRRMSLADISKITKIDIGHLSHIEKGQRNPSYKTLKLICDALEIPVAQFLNYTGKELNEDQEEYNYIQFIPFNLVPVVDIKEYVEGPCDTDKNVMAVIVSDDSMEDKYKKNSKVFVELYTPLNHKDIGLFLFNNKILIREFVIKNNNIQLKAYNKEYDDILIDMGKDNFKIIGKIMK